MAANVVVEVSENQLGSMSTMSSNGYGCRTHYSFIFASGLIGLWPVLSAAFKCGHRPLMFDNCSVASRAHSLLIDSCVLCVIV